MGINVPVPKTIKDRAIYQAFVKVAQALQRAAILTLPNTGTVNVTDDPAIPNNPNLQLLEEIDVDTGISYTEWVQPSTIFNFRAYVTAGSATFADPTEAQIAVETRVLPVSLGVQNIVIRLSVYTRRITAVSGVVVTWEAQKLS